MEGVVEAARGQARSGGGAWEWLTRRNAMRAASARTRNRGVRELELRQKALLANEVAERLFDPIEPLRSGSAHAIATDLYRQSAYFALCSLQHNGATPAAAEVWQGLSAEQLSFALPDPNERELMRELFVSASFVSLAHESEAAQQVQAKRARSFAAAMLELCEGDQRLVGRLRFQRFVRAAGLVLLLCVGVFYAQRALEVYRLGPDLLEGKPWRASSQWATCNGSDCGGLATKVFFHTNEDDKPWIVYDMGAPRTFSKVFIRNRTDDAAERAVPLQIEVSNDGSRYTRVLKRNENFREWMAEFPAQTARYLRLRVSRRSYLHLEQVKVYK